MTVAADPYASFSKSPSDFGTIGRLVTPGSTDLSPIPKGVVCVSTGNITVIPYGNADADVVAFVAVAAGFVPPFRVRRVTAATATVWTVEDA